MLTPSKYIQSNLLKPTIKAMFYRTLYNATRSLYLKGLMYTLYMSYTMMDDTAITSPDPVDISAIVIEVMRR